MEHLQYPIGRFTLPEKLEDETRMALITVMEQSPERLGKAVNGLTEEQLETPYRPGGWTVRQVVHHLADADMNCFIRTKLALTEEEPMIKPFDEIWAELADSKIAPIDLSLSLHDLLHKRWVLLLRSLTPDQFARGYRHPINGLWSLDQALAFFAWHNQHHIAHITSLRERNNM
jgi:uncharacterized damage-inducible protein DinB